MESKSTPPPQPAAPPDPLGSGEFEVGSTVKDLAFFQERKERLASALSILGSIIASENRPLILARLRGGASASQGGGHAGGHSSTPQSWIVPVAFLGSILCGAAGILFLIDAERPAKTMAWSLIAGSVVFGVAAFALLKKGAATPRAANPSQAASHDTAAQGAQADAERLAGEFLETVKPLVAELRMTINLDDLESLLGELKTYEEYGRDLEDFHVTP